MTLKWRTFLSPNEGEKEIKIAETEMPGLMSIREEFGTGEAISKGARIAGCLTHDHPDSSTD